LFVPSPDGSANTSKSRSNRQRQRQSFACIKFDLCTIGVIVPCRNDTTPPDELVVSPARLDLSACGFDLLGTRQINAVAGMLDHISHRYERSRETKKPAVPKVAFLPLKLPVKTECDKPKTLG